MHQANALGRCVGKVGSFGYTVLGVNARSTSGNNDWTIVSLGGINIETTNNALPVRRQRKYSVYCKRYFTQVLWQVCPTSNSRFQYPTTRHRITWAVNSCFTTINVLLPGNTHICHSQCRDAVPNYSM